jgi:glycosyltransferase involved in cell wall biosynthesis
LGEVLHRIWRTIPGPLRRAAVFAATAPAATWTVRGRDPRPGPVAVAGLLRSATGLGQGARLCHAALRELGLAPRHKDLGRVFRWHGDMALPAGAEAGAGEGGSMIIHLNPPQLPLAILAIGRARLKHKRLIGYWNWELPDIPEVWKRGFRYLDEVWVPAPFVAEAVRPHSDLPLRIVPHPVRRPATSGKARRDFELPENAFVCLSVFNAWSGYVRKNPLAVIRAFRRAFGKGSDALLVLKITNGAQTPQAMAEIAREIDGAANIRILEEKLPADDLSAMMAWSDAVGSLHRAEGFGLPLAEAMLLGKPVVATGWSGNMAFMNEGNAALVDYRLVPVRDPQKIYREADQNWAEPDVEHAAEWLKNLANDEDLRARIGAAAAREAAAFFSPEAYRAAIAGSGLEPGEAATTARPGEAA